MKIYSRIPIIKEPTAVALGFFDGCHLGHQLILKAIAESPYLPTVLTYKTEWGTPDRKTRISRLFPYSARHDKMSEFGIKSIIEPEFIRIKNIKPAEFVKEILFKRINAKLIACGNDYKFGNNASGNVELLKKMCDAEGVELKFANPIKYMGQTISTSRIKNILEEGEVSIASKMLGYDYFLNSKVIEGNKLGRTIGFPTINQKFETGILSPKHGVYASATLIKNQLMPSITNVGIRPTFGNAKSPLAETHILNFSSNLYDRNIKVILFDFIRPEQKFSSIDALKDEIEKNIAEAGMIHNNFFKSKF